MNTPRVVWCCVLLLLAAAGCEKSHRRGAEPNANESTPRASQPTAAEPSSPEPEPAPPSAAMPDAPAGGTNPEPTATQRPDPPDDKPADKPAVPAPISEWRMMGYDLGSTYFNRTETKLTKQNAGQLKLAWQANMGGSIYGTALQIGAVIYASGPKDVRAFDADSGKELWSVAATSMSSLSYADGTLYLNTSGAKLIALQASDGKMLWTSPADDPPSDGFSSPIPVGDLLLVGGSNGGRELTGDPFQGYVTALHRKTGERVWRTLTTPGGTNGVSVWSTTSVDEQAGRVFASTGNNFGPPASNTSDAILSFELKSGTLAWANQRVKNDIWYAGMSSPDADFGANPVLYEAMVAGELTKLVAAGSKAGEAHGLRRDDGTLVWTRKLCEGSADGSRGIYLNSSWSGRYVLVACNQQGPATLFALDGGSGDIVWQRALEESVWSRISIANGVGFLGSGQQLVAFDADTGEVIAKYPSPGGTVASIITIANGRVAFGEGLTWSTGRAGTKLTVLTVP